MFVKRGWVAGWLLGWLEEGVDFVGDVALRAADGFAAGLGFGGAAVEVGAGSFVVA